MLSRRELLSAGAALACAGPVASADETPAFIDTHTHFYDPTRKEGVPWPGKDDAVLYRPVLPKEFAKLAAPHGVTRTVVVEASPRVEDNQWLLDLAKDNPAVVGVVGRLLLTDGDFAKHLARFAKNPLFRGIRVNEDEVRAALKDDKQLDRLKAFRDTGLTLDLNGGPEALSVAAAVADQFPKLRVVVNHMGNPLIDGKEPPAAWLKALALAWKAGANVFCKLSALVDGTRKRGGAPADPKFYRAVCDAVWAAFGADRLLYGSNWPVSDLYAKYDTVFALAHGFVEGKDKGAVAKVFAANARVAYQLPKG